MSRKANQPSKPSPNDPVRWARRVEGILRILRVMDPETRDRLLDLLDAMFG